MRGPASFAASTGLVPARGIADVHAEADARVYPFDGGESRLRRGEMLVRGSVIVERDLDVVFLRTSQSGAESRSWVR